MSEERVLNTRPLSDDSKLLRQKFYEQFVSQSEQMDKLAGQLLTLELAIPGLYAAVLKLTQGQTAVVAVNGWFYLTFACWLLALCLTLLSLIPRRWRVDPTIIKGDPAERSRAMGLEDFFKRSAQHKRRLLLPAIFLFWVGILASLFVLF